MKDPIIVCMIFLISNLLLLDVIGVNPILDLGSHMRTKGWMFDRKIRITKYRRLAISDPPTALPDIGENKTVYWHRLCEIK